MNRRLVLGVLSGLAAIALAAGGTTYSAFRDFGQVDGSVVGAGFLKLHLSAGGSVDAPLSFGEVMPGQTAGRLVWVSSEGGVGVPDANLYLTFHDLADRAGPCGTSRGKATGEIESGIGGCSVVGDVVSGTPEQGNLSRVLGFQVAYFPGISNATACADVPDPQPRTSILAEAPGNLYASATADGGAGARYQLRQADARTPLVLAAGAGVCIGIDAGWPSDTRAPGRPSQDYPSDNAAQGDSLTVNVRFDLVQVG